MGRYEDYCAEISQSYVLGFPPYRLRTNVDGTFVTPILVFNGWVYVLADVGTMDITKRHIVGDKSKLVYFVEADGGSGVALQGPSRSLEEPSGRQGPARKRGVVGCEVPPGKIGKIGPPGPTESKGNVGARGEKGNVGPST